MLKKIPTGVVNYKELKLNNYYTVDKTMVLHEFMERASKVTLITRPRRFGKTSNMSMMAEFFDITKDSNELFKDTKIANTIYYNERNQYPTIFISFASAKGNLENVVKFIKLELQREYDRYHHVFHELTVFQKFVYENLVKSLIDFKNYSLIDIDNALSFLIEKLDEYYGKKVMVFIDEYDTPFIEAHVAGFYQEIQTGLVSLFHSSLKDNDHLQYAMITGIQRVAKENIFSDLNNLDVYSVKDTPYAEYFGFTKEETKTLLEYYGLEYNEDVRSMYDGYQMGEVTIYNPWSLINYVKKRKLEPYWLNTSSNGMIKKAMAQASDEFYQDYETLIQKGAVKTDVNLITSYYEQASTSNLWGLFVNAGYLTIINTFDEEECEIRIPNREVLGEFKSLTAYYLQVEPKQLSDMYKGLKEQKQDKFHQAYATVLNMNPSFHDLQNENSYHMLVLGICLYIKNDYEIISNRETGKGRSDIILQAKRNDLASYVIEFKYTKDKKQDLSKLAEQAVKQIVEKEYDVELQGSIIHIGLAHRGKEVEMVWRKKD